MCRYCEMPEEVFDGYEERAARYIDHKPQGWYVEAYPTWDDNRFGTQIKLVFVRDDRDKDDGTRRLSEIEGWHLASWNHEFMSFEIGGACIFCPVCGRELMVREVGGNATGEQGEEPVGAAGESAVAG